jgi:hypothetical protein
MSGDKIDAVLKTAMEFATGIATGLPTIGRYATG